MLQLRNGTEHTHTIFAKIVTKDQRQLIESLNFKVHTFYED